MTSTTHLRLVLAPLVGVLALMSVAGCSSSNVECSGTSCTATLTGDGATATILNNDLGFAGVTDGKAQLSVGDQTVSCAEGDSVAAGPLSLTCTSVTDDSVSVTASLG